MNRSMVKRPIAAGCTYTDEHEGMEPATYCHSPATHAIPCTEYDARLGREQLWWELRCDEHLDDEDGVELHECELRVPVIEDDDE